MMELLGPSWPLVALLGIGAFMVTVHWFRDTIAGAIANPPLRFDFALRVLHAAAETKDHDSRVEKARATVQSPPTSEDLNIEQMVIRDSVGKGRILLKVMNDGSAMLGMFSEDGKPGALLRTVLRSTAKQT